MRTKLFVLAVAPAVMLHAAADGNFMQCPDQPGTKIRAVAVRALTHALRPIDGLHANNFSLKWNGSQEDLCGFAHVRLPVSVGILLDTSGSMRLEGRMALALGGLDRFLAQSGPQDEFFLVSAAQDPALRTGFTSDISRIRAAAANAPAGLTALVDSIYLSLNEFRHAHHSNRALVVISDGGDNQSAYTRSDLLAALAEEPVPVFLLDPARVGQYRPHLPFDEETARTELHRLAAATGGFGVLAQTPETMRTAAEVVSELIRTPYTLYFADPAGASQRRQLRVDSVGVRPAPRLLYDSIPPRP